MGVGDIALTCRNCGATFHFTEGEQVFYEERTFKPPVYCPDCRDVRRAAVDADRLRPTGGIRRQFETVCSKCGQKTNVPFAPLPDRPVYCETCFAGQRSVPKGDSRLA